MKSKMPSGPVERLFPFVLRSRILIVGRESLSRARSKLHFILVTTDLSENSLTEVLKNYAPYPIVQHFTSADVEKFFAVRNTKIIGFQKSGLAQSIYGELKEHRINKPPLSPKPPPKEPPPEPTENDV